jgi:putative membrane protein
MIMSVALLLVFIFVYVKFTPYNEFVDIKSGNIAVATTFGGAIIGFALPIASAIYFTHSVLEMLLWGLITGVTQLILFSAMQHFFDVRKAVHEDQNLALGIFTGSMAVAVGILNTVSISY